MCVCVYQPSKYHYRSRSRSLSLSPSHTHTHANTHTQPGQQSILHMRSSYFHSLKIIFSSYKCFKFQRHARLACRGLWTRPAGIWLSSATHSPAWTATRSRRGWPRSHRDSHISTFTSLLLPRRRHWTHSVGKWLDSSRERDVAPW